MPTSSEYAVEVRDLAKRYRLGEMDVLHGSLRDAIMRAARRPFRRGEREEIEALGGVSFDVRRGEVLGIIGRNGAGKTTLLKILSGVTDPTSGSARIWGRVGSLLEVGTGFHPELTGRENVFFNGAILGMKRREIERKFDAIVEFAEVERFIDTPVKRYSSGMQLRLAFAVAAHLEPEILIVDEVLAVGDAAFQRKCLGKMGEVSNEGRTVLLVSHNMAAVTSLADRCVWLDQGRVRDVGDTSEIVSEYLAGDAVSERPGFADLSDPKLREGVPKRTAKDILFDSVQLVDEKGEPSDVFFEGDPLTIDVTLRSEIASRRLEVLCFVRSMEGVLVFTLTSGLMDVDLKPGAAQLAVKLPRNQLLAGRYALDLYVLTAQPQDYLLGVKTFEVINSRDPSADPRRGRDNLGFVTVEHEWGALRQGDPHRV